MLRHAYGLSISMDKTIFREDLSRLSYRYAYLVDIFTITTIISLAY